VYNNYQAKIALIHSLILNFSYLKRMMDNGIGSDMLSLSLPPLHIAPFFLYKENGASSEEELQGFDDWKVFFEIPHWVSRQF
jgi:hypothetical protein